MSDVPYLAMRRFKTICWVGWVLLYYKELIVGDLLRDEKHLVDLRGLGCRIGGKIRENGVQKMCFRGRQVGAFSVFGQGVYRNPVHKIGIFGLFFGKLTDLGVDVI